MSDATLEQVQQLVDQLSPLEQVRLLEFLAPRIARTVQERESLTTEVVSEENAWAEFFRVGDSIAADDSGTGETLTETILAMRR